MKLIFGIALLYGSLTGFNAIAGDCTKVPQGYMQADENSLVQVFYRPESGQFEVGELFSLEVLVCQDDNPWTGGLTVDATMPAHGHGMNYKPEVAMAVRGQFLAQGLLFQMPGQWRLEFNLETEQGNQHIYSFVDVK